MDSVLLKITGSREYLGESEAICFTTTGKLEKRDGGYTLSYRDGGGDELFETLLTAKDGVVTLIKDEGEPELIFEARKLYSSVYSTPFGNLALELYPTRVNTSLSDNSGHIDLEYVMNLSGAQVVSKLSVSYEGNAEVNRN